MKFEALKSFTWDGRDLKAGDSLEIPDESSKIGPLSRSKFIRVAGAVKAAELPTVKQVAQEAAAGPAVAVAERPDPRAIVRAAKAKAAGKKA